MYTIKRLYVNLSIALFHEISEIPTIVFAKIITITIVKIIKVRKRELEFEPQPNSFST